MAFDVRGGGEKEKPEHVSHEQAEKYFRAAISYVTKSAKAKHVYDELEKLPNKIQVNVFNCNGEDFYAHAFSPGGGYIQWDPLNALQVTEGGWQSPAVALIHEMYHAYQEHILKDIYPNMPTRLVADAPGNPKRPASKEEIATVDFEKNVCKQLAELGHANETARITYHRWIS